MDKDIFSARIKALRIHAKLSQEALADVIGIKKSAVSMIENAQRSVATDTLITLADYFNVSLDYLTGRSDNPEVNHLQQN